MPKWWLKSRVKKNRTDFLRLRFLTGGFNGKASIEPVFIFNIGFFFFSRYAAKSMTGESCILPFFASVFPNITKMRLLISLFWLLSAASIATAQATPTPVQIDPRLYEAFEADYLQRLQTEQPALILRWNYYLDHAFLISEYPPEKGDPGQFPTVQIADPAHFNIFLLEKDQPLARDWDKPMFYRIAGTQKVLMYWSGKEFNRKFQAWLKEQ